LAALTGGDLTSAAMLWSKALEGNLMGVQRLMKAELEGHTEAEKLAIARERLTEAAKAFDAQLIRNCFWGPNHACAGGLRGAEKF